ncbi:MAG: hypothetical protein JJD98_00305 [Polaromonas sp.]|nr:hypothetical protein [Polaromonas sp.]
MKNENYATRLERGFAAEWKMTAQPATTSLAAQVEALTNEVTFFKDAAAKFCTDLAFAESMLTSAEAKRDALTAALKSESDSHEAWQNEHLLVDGAQCRQIWELEAERDALVSAIAKPLPTKLRKIGGGFDTVTREHTATYEWRYPIGTHAPMEIEVNTQPVSAKPPWTTCPDCGYDIARASAKPLVPMSDIHRKAIIESAINSKTEIGDMEYVSWIIDATERVHKIGVKS